MDDKEGLFGEITLALGFVSPAQLRECTEICETTRAYGMPGDLGQALRERRYLTSAQCDQVERRLAFLASRKEDKLYGAIAVKGGLTTQAQVDECLEEQKRRVQVGDGRLVRLPEMMRERGCIDEQEDLVLKEAVKQAMRTCPPVKVVWRGGFHAHGSPAAGCDHSVPFQPLGMQRPQGPTRASASEEARGPSHARGTVIRLLFAAENPQDRALAQALQGEAWGEVRSVAEEILQDRPNHPVALDVLADLLRREGDSSGAIELYERLLRHVPGHLDASRKLAVLYSQAQRWELAASRMGAVIEGDPGDFSTYLQLADVHLRQGRHREAIAVYRAARRVAPRHRELAFRLCELLEGERDLRGVVEVLEELQRAWPEDEEIERRLRAARCSSLARRIAELRVALVLNPASAELHLEMASSLVERGDREEAIQEFEAAIHHGASTTRILPSLERAVYADLSWTAGVAMLRDAYLRVQSHDRAVQLLESRAAAGESTVGTEVDLIELYVAVGQPDRAVERMRTLLSRPDAPQEEMIGIARRILDGEPMRADAHRFLADLYRRKGDIGRVAHHLRTYVHVEGKDASALRKLATTLDSLGDAPGAAVALRAFVRERPNDAGAWTALGKLSLAQGRIDEAGEAARHAVSLAPSDRACAELARGVEERLLDREIERHLAALDVDPRRTNVRNDLAEAYRRRGKMADAMRQIDLAGQDADYILAARATRILTEQSMYDPCGVPLFDRLHRIEELRRHIHRCASVETGGCDGGSPGGEASGQPQSPPGATRPRAT